MGLSSGKYKDFCSVVIECVDLKICSFREILVGTL